MVRDPNQPKRPLSGFFRFAATIRPQLEKETGLKGTKVAGLLAKQWNELADSEKSVFKQQFHIVKYSQNDPLGRTNKKDFVFPG